jgi:hypothetical protein
VPGASLPPSYADHWDAAHVKLPCSPRNVAKGGVAGGRWPVIVQTLSSPLPTYDALEQALVAGQSPPHRARPTTPRGKQSTHSATTPILRGNDWRTWVGGGRLGLSKAAVMEAPCSPSTSDCQPSRHPRRLNQSPFGAGVCR